MRLMTALVLMIFSIAGLGFWVNHSLETAAKQLSSDIRQVTREVERANWDDAFKQIKGFEKEWEKTGSWWPVVMDHQEIDNIEFSLSKAKAYIAEKEPVLSLGQLSELQLMIQHLPEREFVTLKNIL